MVCIVEFENDLSFSFSLKHFFSLYARLHSFHCRIFRNTFFLFSTYFFFAIKCKFFFFSWNSFGFSFPIFRYVPSNVNILLQLNYPIYDVFNVQHSFPFCYFQFYPRNFHTGCIHAGIHAHTGYMLVAEIDDTLFYF